MCCQAQEDANLCVQDVVEGELQDEGQRALQHARRGNRLARGRAAHPQQRRKQFRHLQAGLC